MLANPQEVQLLAVKMVHGSAATLWGSGDYFAGLEGPVVPFVPKAHRGRVLEATCPCGCVAFDGFTWHFPFAVAALPRGLEGPFKVCAGMNPPNFRAQLRDLPKADFLGDVRLVVAELPLSALGENLVWWAEPDFVPTETGCGVLVKSVPSGAQWAVAERDGGLATFWARRSKEGLSETAKAALVQFAKSAPRLPAAGEPWS